MSEEAIGNVSRFLSGLRHIRLHAIGSGRFGIATGASGIVAVRVRRGGAGRGCALINGLVAVFDGRGAVYDSQLNETCTRVRFAASGSREAVDRSKVLSDRVLRMVVVPRQRVNAALAEFEASGLVQRCGDRRIDLLDREALERVAAPARG